MGGFKQLFKVRKPGNGGAFQAKVEAAGKVAVKVVSKVNKLVRSSVKI